MNSANSGSRRLPAYQYNAMTKKSASDHKESRHIVIYGYTRQELSKIIQHFESRLPDFVKITIDSGNLLTKITLTGINSGVELLRFQMNRLHQNLQDLFSEELVTIEDKGLSQVLGELLSEKELIRLCNAPGLPHILWEAWSAIAMMSRRKCWEFQEAI